MSCINVHVHSRIWCITFCVAHKKYFIIFRYLLQKLPGDFDHTVQSTVRRMTTQLFTWYFRFQSTCNRNKFVGVYRWISGFYIKHICIKNVAEPLQPNNHFQWRRMLLLSCVRMFLRPSLQNSGQNHPYIKQHILLLQKWLLSNSVLMYYNIPFRNNFRMNILHGKVIAIE